MIRETLETNVQQQYIFMTTYKRDIEAIVRVNTRQYTFSIVCVIEGKQNKINDMEDRRGRV